MLPRPCPCAAQFELKHADSVALRQFMEQQGVSSGCLLSSLHVAMSTAGLVHALPLHACVSMKGRQRRCQVAGPSACPHKASAQSAGPQLTSSHRTIYAPNTDPARPPPGPTSPPHDPHDL